MLFLVQDRIQREASVLFSFFFTFHKNILIFLTTSRVLTHQERSPP